MERKSDGALPMTVRGDRRRRREQIQRYIFGFLGSVLFSLTLCAEVQGPFSHKKHAPLKLKCVSCHSQSEKGDLAGFPAVANCKVCHVDIAEREIPSQRVYELPDFAFFSHGKHAAAKVECRTCHGDVMKQDVIEAEHPVKMKWCVDCHKRQKAAVTCNTCHELGQ